jgi:hypothetical protein
MSNHLTDWNVSKQTLAESVKVSSYTGPMTFRKEVVFCWLLHAKIPQDRTDLRRGTLYLQLRYLLLACFSLMRLRNKVFRIPPPQNG